MTAMNFVTKLFRSSTSNQSTRHWFIEFDASDSPKKNDDGTWTLPVCMIGKTYHARYEEHIDITSDRLNEMAASIKDAPNGLNINYNHSRNHLVKLPENQVSAGKIVALAVTNGILYATAKLTDKAASFIAAGEFRGTSAEFNVSGWTDKSGKKRNDWALTGLALTNEPHLDQMPTIQDSNGLSFDTNVTEDTNVDKFLKMLECSSEADAIVRIRDLQTAAIELDVVKKKAAEAAVELAKLREFETRINKHLAAANVAEFERLFVSAVRAGLVEPASKSDWKAMYFADAECVTLSDAAARQLQAMAKLPSREGNGRGTDFDASAEDYECGITRIMDRDNINRGDAINKLQRENPGAIIRYMGGV